jgi:hypothetical protein
VLTFSVAAPAAPVATPDDAAVVRFHDEFMTGVRALPGVRSASAINMLPIAATGFNGIVRRADHVGDRDGVPVTEVRVVLDGYLDAMGVRLVAGRAIDGRDRAGTPPVAVVNEVLARRLWPGRPPASVLGERVRAPFDTGSTLREVVGVMADYRSRRPDAPPEPEVHAPFRQVPLGALSYVVRTEGDASRLTGAVGAALARQAPSVALAAVRTFGDVVSTSTRTPQLVARLTGLFGLGAALLAAVGVYGLLSYTTAQRRRELSIRAAVGASRSMLVTLVVREGLALTALGLVAGATIAWGVSGLLSSLLYGVTATDPAVWLGAAAGLSACALLGYALPAVRASRIQPAAALRVE